MRALEPKQPSSSGIITGTAKGLRLRKGIALVLMMLLTLPTLPAAADVQAWNDGKAWTAMVKKAGVAGAMAAINRVNAAIATAQADVAAAQAAIAGVNSLASGAAAVAAVATAAQSAAAAVATMRAAGAAAVRLAPVVAAAGVGTLIGQGLRGLWHVCMDPVCDITSFTPEGEPIYFEASQDEVETLIPQLLQASGLDPDIDFDGAGGAGLASKQMIARGVHQFMGVARGAAAATEGRSAEVRVAMCDLQADLGVYRDTVAEFANVLSASGYISPLADLIASKAEIDEVIAILPDNCNENEGDDCAGIEAGLREASEAFQSAIDELEDVAFPALVGGSDGIFPDLSAAEFEQFLEDCAENGEICLPEEEIVLADAILEAAGTYFPNDPSFGPGIAAYDALEDNGKERALFNTQSGQLNLAELLNGSVVELSTSGAWLDINTVDSPLYPEANARWVDCHDCNNSGAYDTVDIANNTSLDVNENGVPDECENLSEGKEPKGN